MYVLLLLQSLQELKQHPSDRITQWNLMTESTCLRIAHLEQPALKRKKQDEKIPYATTHNPRHHNIVNSSKRFNQ